MFATFQKSHTVNEIDFHLGRLSWLAVRKALVNTSYVCYDLLLSRSICMHFPFVCVGSDWPYASNQQSHILLHITQLLTSDKCTTGRGIYTHTNTCSPAHVQHAYNDIKTKLHNTLTHNGEYTTTYFSPLKHKQVTNLVF